MSQVVLPDPNVGSSVFNQAQGIGLAQYAPQNVRVLIGSSSPLETVKQNGNGFVSGTLTLVNPRVVQPKLKICPWTFFNNAADGSTLDLTPKQIINGRVVIRAPQGDFRQIRFPSAIDIFRQLKILSIPSGQPLNLVPNNWVRSLKGKFTLRVYVNAGLNIVMPADGSNFFLNDNALPVLATPNFVIIVKPVLGTSQWARVFKFHFTIDWNAQNNPILLLSW